MDAKDVAKKLAKIMTLHCCRNTFIEELHTGTTPSSKTGDFSDVKVVTPYGEIPWTKIARISNEEMKKLNKEIANKIYTFLDQLISKGTVPMHPVYFFEPKDWDDPEIDPDIKFAFDKLSEEKGKEK
ncbi:MAG: hypothetical protein L6416_06635 [Candidatus Omnitrophica bacterium]|nr:hypothetical protein [Candidatus Omnitrophota bacterium]